MKQLDNTKKNILLTGASGKIGRVLCQHLLEENYNILALTNRHQSFMELSNQYASHINLGRILIQKIDLCIEQERNHLVSLINKSDMSLYGIINNARSQETLKQNDEGHISAENFFSEFHLGIYAPYDLVWRLGNMPSLNLKRVINISSIYGVVATNILIYDSAAQPLPLHYGVVKSALIHMTKELAVRLSSKGLTVNAISYGGIEGRADHQFKKRYAQLSPQSTMLQHDDLAGAVSFLLSHQAKAVNGHNLLVDGGWTIW